MQGCVCLLERVEWVVIPVVVFYGPLHTRAKSRDHEFVRAQKKVSKGRPNTPLKSCSVGTNLKCSVKSYVIGLSTKCCSNEILFMLVLTHDKIE